MPIAQGIKKLVVLAPQSAKGTPAPANINTAQYLRQETSGLNLTKETYQSIEKRPDMQIGDMRHGVRSVGGTIAGDLSPGTYRRLMAAILRQEWQTPATTGTLINITAAVVSGASGTFTRATTNYITDGFKVGDVIRWSGWASPATANNAHNFMITALTATVMTGIMLDGVPVVAKAAGDSVTATVVGKKTWTPITGHTEQYFSIEHNYPDVDLSELFVDCKVSALAIKLPASGMAKIDVEIMGLDMIPKDSAEAPYFTAVLAASTSGVLAAVNGALYIQGNKVALLTGLDFDVAGGQTSEPVVGSNIKPDLFDGRVIVKGTMSVFFENATFRDYFVNETEVSINCAFTTSNLPNADFLAFSMSRVKVGGASKGDGEKGIPQSMPFVALFNTGGGAAVNTLATTLSIQDSLAT
ncbi:MAG: phage tail tube protein [Smithella sp.]|nr:phage tail tube protein [Smithella sp.]